MRTSSHRFTLSAYSASSWRRSLHDRRFRPLTCAKPVRPGRTKNRALSASEKYGRYCGRSGRGPTTLMSPRSTFHRLGSSSRLVRRKKRPSGVRRAASSPRSSPQPGSRMVRNLTITKSFPCKPGRSWRNKTGRPMVRRIRTATTTMGRANTHPATTAKMTSNTRLPHLGHQFMPHPRPRRRDARRQRAPTPDPCLAP